MTAAAPSLPYRRIDQAVAGFAEGDAISNYALALRDFVRGWGMESDIFADMRHVSPDMQKQARPLDSCNCGPRDLLIHHYSIESPAVDLFERTASAKLLIYHNITPSEFYRGLDDRVANQLDAARTRLAKLLPLVSGAWAVSEFNAGELRALGGRNVRVFPLVFSPAQLDLSPDHCVFDKFPVKMNNILFVGRMAPNKRIEDLIYGYAWYYRLFDRRSRLVIVGSERSCPRYFTMLRMLVHELDLPNVCFERYAAPNGLPAYYELASLFATTSAHEGFCLPLVEAMHKGVPVLARNTGGVPEALGGAGVMYENATPFELAELMRRLVFDGALRAEVLSSQAKRLVEIRARNPAAEFAGHLSAMKPGS